MAADSAFIERTGLNWRAGRASSSSRAVAEETAIALTFDGSTYAVMMATPADLKDFGVGFAVTEGIVARADEIGSLDLIETDLGIEVRIWLGEDRTKVLFARRRTIMGPVGCGLCGIESLVQARRAVPRVKKGATFDARDLLEAMRALPPMQDLNQKTRAVHAAAFWQADGGVGPVREDVGRHNALDKLAGSLIRHNRSVSNGAVLLTSRISVEMVQKTAMIGAPVIVAVSAPTTLAIKTADEAGITLIAVARDDGYEVFTHPDRIVFAEGTRRRPVKTGDGFATV
jgi:FdhD protein